MRKGYPDGCLTVFGNLFIIRCRRCRPLVVAIGTAGETACPTLLDQSFGELRGAGGFACRWKLISIAHPNPEKRLCTRRGWVTPEVEPSARENEIAVCGKPIPPPRPRFSAPSARRRHDPLAYPARPRFVAGLGLAAPRFAS